MDVNSWGNLLVLVYSDWLTFPSTDLSPDSRLEDGERFRSALNFDDLELQELGCPRDLACGGHQKNQPAVEWSTLKQRYNSDPHVGSEMAEPCVMWRKLWVGEFTVNWSVP